MIEVFESEYNHYRNISFQAKRKILEYKRAKLKKYSGRQWYIIKTTSKFEYQVASCLTDMGIPAYLPLRRSDSIGEKLLYSSEPRKALFPKTIFAALTEHEFKELGVFHIDELMLLDDPELQLQLLDEIQIVSGIEKINKAANFVLARSFKHAITDFITVGKSFTIGRSKISETQYSLYIYLKLLHRKIEFPIISDETVQSLLMG